MKAFSIRPVMNLDAAITGVTGLLMLVAAAPLGDLLDLPTALLAVAGAVLIPYVACLLWLATRAEVPRTGVLAVIALNVAWGLGCVALLVSGQVEPNALGMAFVLVQAVAVLVFADLQALALRGNTTTRARERLSLEV